MFSKIAAKVSLQLFFFLTTLIFQAGFADEPTEELNYRTASTRSQLSESELAELLRNNTFLNLRELESLTERQAEMLGKSVGFCLDRLQLVCVVGKTF